MPNFTLRRKKGRPAEGAKASSLHTYASNSELPKTSMSYEIDLTCGSRSSTAAPADGSLFRAEDLSGMTPLSAPPTPNKSKRFTTANQPKTADLNDCSSELSRSGSFRATSRWKLGRGFRGRSREILRSNASSAALPHSAESNSTQHSPLRGASPSHSRDGSASNSGRESGELHVGGPGSMISLLQKFVSETSTSNSVTPVLKEDTEMGRPLEDTDLPSISLEDLSTSQDDKTQLGDELVSAGSAKIPIGRRSQGHMSSQSSSSNHSQLASSGNGQQMEKSNKTLFSFSSTSSSTDSGGFASRLRRKTVPKFFSSDSTVSDETRPSSQAESIADSEVSEASDDKHSKLSPTAEKHFLSPNISLRPFPMIRSISSRSEEVHKEKEQGDNSKEESPTTRPRSRTLNSLRNDSGTVSPTSSGSSVTGTGSASANMNFGHLFGVKNDHSRRHSPQSSQYTVAVNPASEIESVEPEADETPKEFVARLRATKLHSTIVIILSKNDTPFSIKALQLYIDSSFDFKGDPIDIALRKFLMAVQLPKETQQIDRILECFADTYQKSNSSIYLGSETAYIIAFSLMILHTDFFNKNNKHKMQKSEYIRNTYAKGVQKDILEYFYDNITYTPFIHTDEDVANGLNGRHWARRSSSFGRNGKDLLDPYTLILENRLDIIRPSLKSVLTTKDPYDFIPVGDKIEFNSLREQFVHGPYLQLVSSRSRPEAFLSAKGLDDLERGVPGMVDIKVVKIGILYRREARRMIYSKSTWKEWGAILTASQLYLFKDVSWIKSCLLNQHGDDTATAGRIINAPIDGFHPSAVLSTIDMAALLHDTGEVGLVNAFLLAGRGGAQDWFAASSEEEMTDWIKKINFAASFNTYHVSIYGIGKTDRSVKLQNRLQSQIDQSPLLSTFGEASDDEDEQLNSEFSHLDSEEPYTSTSTETEIVEQIESLKQSPSIPKIALGYALKDHKQRYLAVTRKLQEINEKLADIDEQLDRHIRNGNHLQLLAPIQQRTREAIIFAAGHLTAKLDWNWLEKKRLLCYKDVFLKEEEIEADLCAQFEGETHEEAKLQLASPEPIHVTQSDTTSLKTSGSNDAVSVITEKPVSSRAASLNSEDRALTPQGTRASQSTTNKSIITSTSLHTGNSGDRLADENMPTSPISSNSIYYDASLDANSIKDATDSASYGTTISRTNTPTSISSTPMHKTAGPNAVSASPKAPQQGITVKKNFRRLSLREKKDGAHAPSSKGAAASNGSHEEIQRSASLMRKEGEDFTLHGKKFSVVEVNPEFAATPNHQRRTSQTVQLDKIETFAKDGLAAVEEKKSQKAAVEAVSQLVDDDADSQ